MLHLEKYPHVKAIHVLQNDKIIFNSMNDCDNYDLFPVGCIFKTFLSALVGVAIHEGKIGSVKDKVIDYYPKCEINTFGWDNLQISHVLSKTTGIV